MLECTEFFQHCEVEESMEWLEDLSTDCELDLPHSDKSVFSVETIETVEAMLNTINQEENYDFEEHDDGAEAGWRIR